MEKKVKILLIEDDKIDQMAFERLVKREDLPYDYQIAGSVSEARAILAAERFEAVLMDYMLGDGTAFDLFGEARDAPIVMMTGSGDEAVAVQAMKAGAYDYLVKDPDGNYLTTLAVTVERAISRRLAEEELKRYRERLEELVAERTAELTRANEELVAEIIMRKRAEEELQRTTENLRKTLGATIQAIAITVETRDPYTAGHQRRVGNLARAIANEMGLPQEQIDGIRMAGLIHDLGKVGIPAEILSKPSRLNDFEWGIIKTHSQIGFDILKTIEFPWPVAQIVLQHHERIDGSGYPRGLSGEEVMLEARILAVADVVEAMASFRPYRPARGLDKALEEISQNRFVLYDPDVVDACLKLFTEKGFTFDAIPPRTSRN